VVAVRIGQDSAGTEAEARHPDVRAARQVHRVAAAFGFDL